MKHHHFSAAVVVLSGLTFLTAHAAAQSAVTVAAVEIPVAPSVSSSLPDAPEPNLPTSNLGDLDDQQAKGAAGPVVANIAPKNASIILPGEKIQPLHGVGEHLIYGMKDSFNVYQLVGITISAGWSQIIDSEPHFGRDAAAFGKREGAAALRSTIQTMGNDVVFSPMFHDDSRYYVMGDGHGFFKRAIYAATRVVITRASATGKDRLNVPLLLSYGVAAGVNNAYYPDQDRGAAKTARNWGTSLGGAALGFEASEFLSDALRIVHIKKD
jgi:hypothetical protein